MTVRIWGANSVEQCTQGQILPADAKPYTDRDSKSVAVTPGFGTFFSWTLAANEDFYFQTLVGQGNVAGLYTVKVDFGSGAVEVAWSRSSTADPTGRIDLGTGYIKVPAGSTLTVEVCHWTVSGAKDFDVTIGGGLVTGN